MTPPSVECFEGEALIVGLVVGFLCGIWAMLVALSALDDGTARWVRAAIKRVRRRVGRVL